MLLIGGMILFILVCFLLAKSNCDFLDVIGAFLGFIFAVMLMCILVAIPINHMEINSHIEKIEAAKETIDLARENGYSLERVRLQKDIIQHNEWLASKKYYNKTVLDLWIPDEIEKVQPIK